MQMQNYLSLKKSLLSSIDSLLVVMSIQLDTIIKCK